MACGARAFDVCPCKEAFGFSGPAAHAFFSQSNKNKVSQSPINEASSNFSS